MSCMKTPPLDEHLFAIEPQCASSWSSLEKERKVVWLN
ncbi:hypothetical protein LDG_7295 [Legionella drancourtii LLAP12]|uniref:Uncharacterized protein n=1 Tax=Legionella drancourtii LLAP12 TaxID=658187 RepID=G9EPV4_9GAMM|nr:hypothetical protein LDG_7295 [Legionella drancourtii LLAP12]